MLAIKPTNRFIQEEPVGYATAVWVSAHPYGNKQDSAISTNENGVAEFTNIPPGKVLFRTEKKGYGETSSEIVETGTLDAPTKVTVVLSAPSSISGRITFRDGSPAEGWDIFVHNLSTARRIELTSIISTRVKTDTGGNYTISGLGKGEYTFFIIKYGDFGKQRVSTDRVITLQDGEDKQGVDFVIEEGTETVAGIVLSQDGNPIPGAKVMVHPVGGSGPNTIFLEAVSITDGKGEFSVGKLHKKSHIMVEAEAEGYKPFRSGFPMDEYVTVTLTSAEIISGIVQDQSTQQPIAGASVILRGRFVRDRVEITSVNGTFSFGNFEAGTYQLFAFADGYAYSQILQIETESNIQANPIVLPLEKANEFRGVVADSSGKPVLGAIVGLQSRMKNPNVPEEYRGIIFTETSLSNNNGAFLISNRAHQPDTLIIGHPQFALAAYPLPAEWDNNQPPVFFLNQGGAVEGVVFNEEHNPITQGEIHFVDGSNLLFGGKAKIEASGFYRIDRLPASNYRVHLYANIEKDMGFVQVLENQTSRIDFVAGK